MVIQASLPSHLEYFSRRSQPVGCQVQLGPTECLSRSTIRATDLHRQGFCTSSGDNTAWVYFAGLDSARA
jgi:hypothetical protein